MPGLVKKVVRSEYIDLVEGQEGLTFGQHIDHQIKQALEAHEDVQEFNLIFEESEWRGMMRRDGSPHRKPTVKSRPV